MYKIEIMFKAYDEKQSYSVATRSDDGRRRVDNDGRDWCVMGSFRNRDVITSYAAHDAEVAAR